MRKKSARWLRWHIDGLLGDEKSRLYNLLLQDAKAAQEEKEDEDVHLPSWVMVQ